MRPVFTRYAAFTRYAVAWCYLAAFCVADLVYAVLPDRDQASVLAWASTNGHNLVHDPLGCMIASAFFPAGALLAWPVLIALAMFGANAVLGNWRTAVTCAAGHVIGTLVSEGILAYQIAHGIRPGADRFITDVGPSYVVVTALAVGLLWGRWPVRGAAALDLAGLVFVGGIFSGLSQLAVAAVGHATALVTGCVLGSLLVWQRRRQLAAVRLAADRQERPPQPEPGREDRDLENQEK
jgi:Rhomboid-like protein